MLNRGEGRNRDKPGEEKKRLGLRVGGAGSSLRNQALPFQGEPLFGYYDRED